MSGSAEEPSVEITASPHAQPAVLMLARACIALARLQLTEEKKPRSTQPPDRGGDGSVPEQSHE
jgi:hypothetical protein